MHRFGSVFVPHTSKEKTSVPEGAGVTVPNEPDGNSDLDEQMEMSPSLAANPTPIQVSKEIPDLTPFLRRAVAT
ncbi:hypothetical protein AVEN_149294-1 [Araneus ventricosus]|uniref:Uncharacterized protein n=1 Tax=Araneus ventricosus TaxID=182803 RepID=A0A4Y2T2L3_ARAVE|nr:hypothetical protein AVEN_149294-1 [Araneus ventricosus]